MDLIAVAVLASSSAGVFGALQTAWVTPTIARCPSGAEVCLGGKGSCQRHSCNDFSKGEPCRAVLRNADDNGHMSVVAVR